MNILWIYIPTSTGRGVRLRLLLFCFSISTTHFLANSELLSSHAPFTRRIPIPHYHGKKLFLKRQYLSSTERILLASSKPFCQAELLKTYNQTTGTNKHPSRCKSTGTRSQKSLNRRVQSWAPQTAGTFDSASGDYSSSFCGPTLDTSHLLTCSSRKTK